MNDIVMYCPQTNEIIIHNNRYSLPLSIAIEVIWLGLKNKYTLEYIGML